MSTKRTIKNTLRVSPHGELSFTATDGSLHAYPAYGGGFFLFTRPDDKRTTGVSLTRDELTELAAALLQLAQNDERTA